MPISHPQPVPGVPERIGHRGAPREFDENSAPGFARAIERGADAVELDVHLSRDGLVVVHHDADVLTADGHRRAIRELSLAELRECPLPRGGRIPTLEEVFRTVEERGTVYVELKGEGTGEPSVAVAAAHGHRYAFHAFDHATVLALRALHPELAYGALLDRGTRDPAGAAAALPVRDIWAHWSLVDAALVQGVHAAGRRLIVWTVNDAAMARRLAALGVDGLCGDDVRVFPASPAG